MAARAGYSEKRSDIEPPRSDAKWTPQRIRRLRLFNDWTQQALAERLGVHTMTVSSWENGRWSPDPETESLLDRVESQAAVVH